MPNLSTATHFYDSKLIGTYKIHNQVDESTKQIAFTDLIKKICDNKECNTVLDGNKNIIEIN